MGCAKGNEPVHLAVEEEICVKLVKLREEESSCSVPSGRVGVCISAAEKATLCTSGLTKQTLLLEQGDACLLAPEEIFTVKGDEGSLTIVNVEAGSLLWRYTGILEEFPVLQRFAVGCQRGSQTGPVRLANQWQEQIGYILSDMLREYEERQVGYQISLQGSLARILVMLARSVKEKQDRTQDDRLILEILRYLSENVRKATLKDTAARFYYHPNTINRLLLRKTGKTFSGIMRELRMGYTIQLLTETELPVRRVAELCGYQNMTYFYRVFHQSYGMTPFEYRNEIRAQGG